jgi:hypothetical protein
MNRASAKQEKKKPYEPPKLIVYGNLGEMTQSKGTFGQPDRGGTGLKRKTGG